MIIFKKSYKIKNEQKLKYNLYIIQGHLRNNLIEVEMFYTDFESIIKFN